MSRPEESQFESAVSHSKSYACNDISAEQKARLNGYFNQALNGDCQGIRPDDLDGRLMFDYWALLLGMSSNDAKYAYVKLIKEIDSSFIGELANLTTPSATIEDQNHKIVTNIFDVIHPAIDTDSSNISKWKLKPEIVKQCFEAAVNHASSAACKNATQDQKAKLYGAFKQANKGDCEGIRPGVFDPVNRFKFDAWNALQGQSKSDARIQYIETVMEIDQNWIPQSLQDISSNSPKRTKKYSTRTLRPMARPNRKAPRSKQEVENTSTTSTSSSTSLISRLSPLSPLSQPASVVKKNHIKNISIQEKKNKLLSYFEIFLLNLLFLILLCLQFYYFHSMEISTNHHFHTQFIGSILLNIAFILMLYQMIYHFKKKNSKKKIENLIQNNSQINKTSQPLLENVKMSNDAISYFEGNWVKDLDRSSSQDEHMIALGVPWLIRAAINRSSQETEIKTNGKTWVETTINLGGRKVQTLQLDGSLQERRNPIDSTPVKMTSLLRSDGCVVTESEYLAIGIKQILTRRVHRGDDISSSPSSSSSSPIEASSRNNGFRRDIYHVTNVMTCKDGTVLVAQSYFNRI